MSRGYFGIGIYHPKHEVNTGTLWRSASSFGAAFTFTVGKRFDRQSSDTCASDRHCPMYHYADIDDLIAHLPHSCPLVGVELADDAEPLDQFWHMERACYMLGAEDHGIPTNVLALCHKRVVIPHCRRCLNVASAGTVVLYHRAAQQEARRLSGAIA